MSAISELHASICECYSQAVQHAAAHGMSEYAVRTAFEATVDLFDEYMREHGVTVFS